MDGAEDAVITTVIIVAITDIPLESTFGDLRRK
jgi:hypothetical protein